MACCFVTAVQTPQPPPIVLPTNLKGVNLAGAEFGPQALPGQIGTNYLWPTTTEINYYAGKGFNFARIPFLWERIQPTANAALNATYLNALLTTIDAARAAGMWAMPDMHNYWRYFGNLLNQSNFVDAWSRIAGAIGGRDKLILGLMNEPYGVTASTVVSGHNAAIAAIRAAGYTGVIAVSGTAWDGAHSWSSSGNAAAFALLADNPGIVIEVHQYLDADGAGDSTNCAVGTGTLAGDAVFRLSGFTDWARANGHTALLTEWSYTPANTTCESWVPAMLANMTANSDVWRGWAYWANFPTAYGPHDSNPQLLNPLAGNIDRPQIAVLTGAEPPPPPPPPPTNSGDRNIPWQITFPSSMFVENGGRVVNVMTSIPFVTNGAQDNAAGNGTADDSNSIIAAIDYVKNRLVATGRNSPNGSYLIYFPGSEGAPRTYRVTKEITWTGSIDEGNLSQYWRLWGEDRRFCKIRLANNSAGYGGTSKPVVNLAKASINALETKSSIKNLTIAVGAGNPGAVALRWGGANANVIESMTIVSESGAGRYGIDMQNVHQYWVHDITVDGFIIGFNATYQRATSDVIEWSTFKNQTSAAIVAFDNSYMLRKVRSENSGPALRHDGPRSFSFITDCDFVSGASGNAAVQLNGGENHTRDLRTQGYGSAIREGSTVRQAGPNVSEWTSYPSFTLWGTGNPPSKRLPVKDSPTVAWPSAQNFAVITSNTNVQGVFNGGKPGIMFRNFTHSVGTINVPASVRVIFGCYGDVSGTFNVFENSSNPLLIIGVDSANVTSASGVTRTVIIQEGQGLEYQTQNPANGTELFWNCLSGLGTVTMGNAKIWCRMINTEPKNVYAAFTWNGTKVWILGYKTESTARSHVIKGGGHLEILGGFANQTPYKTQIENWPMVEVEDSIASVSILTTGHNNGFGYGQGVRAIKNGVTRTLTFGAMPARGPVADHNAFMPLYTDDLT